MKLQLRNTIKLENGGRWFMCLNGDGEPREFSLMPDVHPFVLDELIRAARDKRTVNIDINDIAVFRRVGSE